MTRAKSFSTKTMAKRIALGFLALIVIVLIVLHLYLSTWLLNYVNDVLAHLNGYSGSAESIDVNLYRGAYQINHLIVNKKEGTIPTPFIAIDKTDLSIEWSALFHGRIVSSATLEHPVINFAVNKSSTQSGIEQDWTKPIKKLMPIDINYVRFKDGDITYQDFSSTPRVNIYVHRMAGEVDNLRNVQEADDPLPSTLTIKGGSIGNGKLDIHGKINILKEVPDMDLLLSLEKVDLPALNNYTDAYGAFSFKSGNFNLYTQLIVKDKQVGGYVKPMATNISVDVQKANNPLQAAWDTAVAGLLEVFTNHSKDQFATRVNLHGNLNSVQPDMWSALAGILRNAFIDAMRNGFEETGNKDLLSPSDQSKP